jgi:hypothetical protein
MWRMLRAALAFTAMLLLSACADPDAFLHSGAKTDATVAQPASRGVVYLLRGGFNIFSTGMDELAAKLRARGIDARSDGHARWRQLAGEARKRYEATGAPIVLIGHSWGALGIMLMADELARTGTPVALMIIYDTTDSLKVPPNVHHVINYRSVSVMGLGLTVTGGYGFAGKIDTIDEPEIGHMRLDNEPSLHQQSIAAVLKVIRPARR